MPRGRPPRAVVRAAVRDCLADLAPGDRVLVALSGGPDSLALLTATVAVGRDQGLVCAAAVIDHGVQPGSAAVAERAAEQARILGCDDVEVVAVQVERGPGAGGLEAAARRARYAALLRCAGRAVETWPDGGDSGWLLSTGPGHTAAILLGHTRDDQAESVLLGLARGSGTRSLAGMPPSSDLFRRPLLDVPRAVVIAAARDAAGEDPRLEPWSDPHNVDAAFARVRVRTEVLPVLEATLGPGVVEALARTARLARADADALDAWADRIWQELRPSSSNLLREGTSAPPHRGADVPQRSKRRGEEGLPVESLLPTAPDPLPEAVVSRVVRRFLLEAGCPRGSLTALHIGAVTALLAEAHTRAEVALPGGRRARREGAALVVRA